MDRQLHELTQAELIEVVQDYQEMVSDIESVLNGAEPGDPWEGNEGKQMRRDIREALYKPRPGWRIHKKEGQQ